MIIILDKTYFETKKIIDNLKYIDEFEFKCDSPKIKDIVEYTAHIKINTNKIIRICNSLKLVIKGMKIINIKYISTENCGKIYCLNLMFPFFQIIDIPSYVDKIKLNSYIAFDDVDHLNCDTIFFYSLITTEVTLLFKCNHNKFNNKNSENCLNINCNDNYLSNIDLTDNCDDNCCDIDFRNDSYKNL